MDFLVCPDDGERVKAISTHVEPGAGPIVRCPRCAKVFVFTAGRLEPITEPGPQ